MAIEKTVHLYEVLFRIAASGAIAAHRKDLERVADPATGEVYAERETDPVPIAGAEVAAVLGEVLSAMTAERDAKAAALAAAEAEREGLRRQLAAVTAERDALREAARPPAAAPAA
ncbi:hypothetical protein M446_5978 [Methylobacterium sp. 4-46]|uniref:hypothetical protein n=1 Tax=unclassified Methylobacterium TaxID=2615210 RepID=UPI000165CBA6|nr:MULTISPECIES: hypothetical protein [Methylobacterium]ACA20255.1 hypothetical protein M446_5978 [Methylobacterium sp. 4-46]WFT79433.1 hypothetical protein QA634_30175 [Methylobacterium nodulans]